MNAVSNDGDWNFSLWHFTSFRKRFFTCMRIFKWSFWIVWVVQLSKFCIAGLKWGFWHCVYVCVCVCARVCVCVCVCVCLFLYASTVKASVCNDVLDILESTDQQSAIFYWEHYTRHSRQVPFISVSESIMFRFHRQTSGLATGKKTIWYVRPRKDDLYWSGY